jgi:hypothetical protein
MLAQGHRASLIRNSKVINSFSNANYKALEIMLERGDLSQRTWLTAEDDPVRPTHVE